MGSPEHRTWLYSKGVDYNRRELKNRIYNFYQHFSRRIEIAADDIIEKSEESEVRLNAVLWKINASTFMQSLVFQPDPLVGYLHSWVYCALITQYFRDGPGKNSFEEWQDIAIDASVSAEKDIALSVQALLPPTEFKTIQKRVYALAEAHPLSSHHLVPDIAFYDLEGILSAGEYSSGLAAVTEINEILHDIVDGGPILVESGLKQARWMVDMYIEEVPEIISKERQEIMGDVHQESKFILDALDKTITEQRNEIFKGVIEERIAILDALRIEREFILATLAEERAHVVDVALQERIEVLKYLREERIAAIEQIEAMTAQMFEEAEVRSLQVIDRIFMRIIQIFAIPFIVIVVLFILGFRSLRRTLIQTKTT